MNAANEKGLPEAAGRPLSETSQSINKGTIVSNSIALNIGTAIVRQAGGLYSLNDLHKASGGEAKHRPNYFLETDQTKDLIAEISNAGIPAFEAKRGKYGGTYACKELVIAYAAWISAVFHLKVIRVFLDAVKPAVAAGATAIDYVRINAAQAQTLKEHVQRVVEAGVQTFGETWNRLHKKFRVNSYFELSAEKFEEACRYLDGKMPQRGAYHFPLASADVHDRQFANTWFTPERLTDPKNPAPELDLIQALERDGHDVTGAKVRILAMRDAMEQMAEMRQGLQAAHSLARKLENIVAVAGEKRGKNVLFAGKPGCSITHNGHSNQIGVA